MKSTNRIRQVIVCLVLAAGCGAIWGLCAGGMETYLTSAFSGPRTYETIYIARDGTPYIETRIGGNYFNRTLRTLDGKKIEEENIDTLSSVTADAPHQIPGLVHWPMEWGSRIAVTADSKLPPTYWVLIRDAQVPGHVYLVGYDSQSDLCVGYLGREGFRSVIPPQDEWFDVGYQTVNYDSNAIVPAGYMSWGGGSFDPNYPRQTGENQFQPWMLFICDGDTVHQIDLREREVREIATFDELVDVEIARLETPKVTTIDELPVRNIKTENRLLVRTADRLVVYNTFDNSQVDFQIPAGLENESLHVTILSAERLILQVIRGDWERGHIVDLLTITPSGEIAHRDTVKRVNYLQPGTARQSLTVAAVAPVLLLWVVGMLLVAPLVNIQKNNADTFQRGLDLAIEAWPGLLIVLVLSIMLTLIVYRWQRKYSRPNTALWTKFVFLTTLPGFFAYWVMHRREPMGECAHCGRAVPQDRDVCARCAMPLPEPKLLGTEIFA